MARAQPADVEDRLAHAIEQRPDPLEVGGRAADAAEPNASVSELVRWVERMSGTEISAGAAPRKTA
jgi:hypothetical protein